MGELVRLIEESWVRLTKDQRRVSAINIRVCEVYKMDNELQTVSIVVILGRCILTENGWTGRGMTER